ncbi:MAG: right-handed parallel beta-helix repeat-containing protein [Candidatus Hydrogenedentota bacterium]
MADAEEFGAKGDGKADDTQALQRAINEGSGVLELAKGSYLISAPLVLDTTQRGYVGVRGAQGASRILMTGPGPALRVIGDHKGTADPKTFEEHTWERERFPVLQGFEVHGRHPEADGIELLRTVQCTIQNVLIRECRYGIHLVERNRNPIVANSHIYRCSDSGIFLDAVNLHQAIIIGNHISYCARGGIRQFNGDVHNIQITGNDIEYNSGYEDGLSGEILLEVPDDGLISEYTIASNTIQAKSHNSGANIVMVGREVPDDSPIRVVSITGNVIGDRNKNIMMRHAQRAIAISGNTMYTGMETSIDLVHCEQVAITGNTINHSPWERGKSDIGGVLLETCRDCTITGNILTGLAYGDDTRGGAVTLTRCSGIAVSDCHILSPLHRGVFLESSTLCRIANNTILERRKEPAMITGVQVTGDSRDNLIQHNHIQSGTAGAVVCEEGQAVVLNNTVYAG